MLVLTAFKIPRTVPSSSMLPLTSSSADFKFSRVSESADFLFSSRTFGRSLLLVNFSPPQASSSTDESSPGCTPRQVRHPGEGEAPGLARGGLKFTKSSERPKVRLENRKSADLESRLNLKSADEEVKGNIEEEGTVRGILKAVSTSI